MTSPLVDFVGSPRPRPEPSPFHVSPSEVVLSDGTVFTPGKGGAGSPELAFMDANGRHYVDNLPWCPLLGTLGIDERGFERNAIFPSVTTRLGYLPKDRLIGWTGSEVAKCAAATPWILERFGERIAIGYWRTAGERKRDEAGERGTLIHDVAEDGEKILHEVADTLLQGRHPDPWFTERSGARAYVRALCKFFEAYPGIRPIWVEVTVFSRRWGIAGTLDLMAWVPRLGWVLLDYKTSRTTQAKFSFQMAAYRLADYGIIDGRRVPLPKVDASYVVHLMPGEFDPETGEHPGAFELVPMDNDPEQLAIFEAMGTVARWEHPSRCGAPLPDPSTDGLTSTVYGVEMPPVRFLTAEQAAASVVAKDETLFESVFGDGAVGVISDGVVVDAAPIDAALEQADIEANAERRVADVYAAQLDTEKAWVAEQVGFIEGKSAAGDLTARHYSTQLAIWWQSSGLVPFHDPRFGIDEEQEPLYQQLLDGLQMASDNLEASFSTRPQRPDFDALYEQFVAEEQERRRQTPKPTMDDLGRLLIASQTGTVDPPNGRAFVLARRGQSVSPDEWGKPADPEMADRCRALRGRAAELPADLVKALDAWRLEAGVPNINAPSVTPQQYDVIAAKVEETFGNWDDRVMAAKMALAEVVTDEDLEEIGTLLLAAAGPADTIRYAEAKQLERFHLLCAAAVRGDVAFSVGDDDRLALRPAVDEPTLVERFGNKTAVRDAARQVSIDLGLKLPRSTADVVKDVLYVAALGSGPATQENEAA